MADFWLTFALTILKGVLAGLHIDPTKLPGLEKILVSVANDIYLLYGLVPPAPPIVQAPAAPTA